MKKDWKDNYGLERQLWIGKTIGPLNLLIGDTSQP
jgi:hypothetical protein